MEPYHGPFCYCDSCTRKDLEHALQQEKQVTTMLICLALLYMVGLAMCG